VIDEKIVSEAIIESYTAKLLNCLELDVAVCGAGPSGLVASCYLARAGLKTAVFERKLSIGGGMWRDSMSANATFGSYRMGPIFGGMLLSGRKVAELIIERSKTEKSRVERGQ